MGWSSVQHPPGVVLVTARAMRHGTPWLAALVVALGLTGCLGSGPDRQERARASAMLSSALGELAATPTIGYHGTPPGAAAGTVAAVHVTSSGASLGTVRLGGATLRLLVVDGKRFVRADAAFWNAHGIARPSLARTYARRWVQIGPRKIAGLPQLRTPAQLAAWVRNSSDPEAAEASDATIGGAKVTRIDLGAGAAYLSTTRPRRIVRLQLAREPAGGPRTAMISALGLAAAASGSAPEPGSVDISAPDAEQVDALFGDMRRHVAELDDAVDSQVSFTNAPAFSCAGTRCTASTSVAAMVPGGGEASGTIEVTLDASMTAQGQTLLCSAQRTIAPNTSALLSCGASFQIPPVQGRAFIPVVGRLNTRANVNVSITKTKRGLMREQRRQRALERRPNAAPQAPGGSRLPPATDKTQRILYSVRLQAQSTGLEKSVPIERTKPVTVAEGLAGLEQLKRMLNAEQLRARTRFFEQAERWILNARRGGGVSPGSGKSFNAGEDIRVDIEIRRGHNFVR